MTLLSVHHGSTADSALGPLGKEVSGHIAFALHLDFTPENETTIFQMHLN